MIIDDIFEIWFKGSIEEIDYQFSLPFFKWIKKYVLTNNFFITTFSERLEIINYLKQQKLYNE